MVGMPIFRTKNEDFFKTWSSQMAYVLGYFSADGSMIKNKRGAHYVNFYSTDKELIMLVQRCFHTNLHIGSSIRNKRWKKAYKIQIGSKKIFHDLLRIGFTPNKKKRLLFPPVPREYFSHRAHRLAFSIHDSVRLYRFMYRDLQNNLFLKRKFKYYQKALRVIPYPSFMVR